MNTTVSQTYIEGLNDFNIPSHMHDGIVRYIERGHAVGGFLSALLSNDLMKAFDRADVENFRHMGDWAKYLHNCAPSDCYGSKEKFDAWQKAGGLKGMFDQSQADGSEP